jgi:hypothetical protein
LDAAGFDVEGGEAKSKSKSPPPAFEVCLGAGAEGVEMGAAGVGGDKRSKPLEEEEGLAFTSVEAVEVEVCGAYQFVTCRKRSLALTTLDSGRGSKVSGSGISGDKTQRLLSYLDRMNESILLIAGQEALWTE